MHLSISHTILSALLLASASIQPIYAAPMSFGGGLHTSDAAEALGANLGRGTNTMTERVGIAAGDLPASSGQAISDIAAPRNSAGDLASTAKASQQATGKSLATEPRKFFHIDYPLPKKPIEAEAIRNGLSGKEVIHPKGMDVFTKDGVVTDVKMANGDIFSKNPDHSFQLTPAGDGKPTILSEHGFPVENGVAIEPRIQSVIRRDPNLIFMPSEVKGLSSPLAKTNTDGTITATYDPTNKGIYYLDKTDGTQFAFGNGFTVYNFKDGSSLKTLADRSAVFTSADTKTTFGITNGGGLASVVNGRPVPIPA